MCPACAGLQTIVASARVTLTQDSEERWRTSRGANKHNGSLWNPTTRSLQSPSVAEQQQLAALKILTVDTPPESEHGYTPLPTLKTPATLHSSARLLHLIQRLGASTVNGSSLVLTPPFVAR